jgi:2-oxoglutarate ferredoxin oxidoreductase subunit beta
MKRELHDYRSAIDTIWCPGCGDFGLLKSVQQALAELDIPPEDVIAVSGIGCSGRLPHFLNVYALHGTHGRAVPTATGAKTARPDMTVLCVGGDGDGLGIGGGHIAHAARKNVDITYLLIDNRIYGLTKGQASPTTPSGWITKTSPHGVYEDPLNPIAIFLSYDVSFIARVTSYQVKELTDIIKQAIAHKGMSIVYVVSPCRTFPVLEAARLKQMFQPLPADHPRDNKLLALERSFATDPQYTGVFYQVNKPTLEDRLQAEIHDICEKENGSQTLSTEELLRSFS